MFRIVRVAAHLLIQAVDYMFDGIHLHHAGVREQLVVTEQRGSAANAAVHTLQHGAHTPLQRPEAAFGSPDGASGIMFRFNMAQRAHDLVEQALACFDFQIVRCLVVVRRRFDFRQSRLDVFLLPVERVDLQLHIPLRIDFSDALLQPCNTFRIRVDDHQHRTTIVGCDSSRQFLHGPSQRNGVRDREHQRQGDGAFRPAERHDRGRTPTLRRHLASLTGDGISCETQHQRNPQKSHDDHHCGNRKNRNQQSPIADLRIIPACAHRIRQQHAKQNEHRAVERKREYPPYA